MTTNFTVILFQRQQFGNEPGSFGDVEPNVPFVGAAKSYSFECPGINSSETAFLMFQSRDGSFTEQSRIARRASTDASATAGRNRSVIVAAIAVTFP